MKQLMILIVLLFSFFHKASALSEALKQKYPNSVLTDDYGILDESDLFDHKPGPFSKKDTPGYVYWQCFPREFLRVTLLDFGYTSKDIGGDENYSGLIIDVSTHEYAVRRRWPLSTYRHRFDVWIKLMQGEKYVCLAGEFYKCENKIGFDGKKYQGCSWTFEKLKTKKGCDSYFVDLCHTNWKKGKKITKISPRHDYQIISTPAHSS